MKNDLESGSRRDVGDSVAHCAGADDSKCSDRQN
jgi:hypothetical protein